MKKMTARETKGNPLIPTPLTRHRAFSFPPSATTCAGLLEVTKVKGHAWCCPEVCNLVKRLLFAPQPFPTTWTSRLCGSCSSEGVSASEEALCSGKDLHLQRLSSQLLITFT